MTGQERGQEPGPRGSMAAELAGMAAQRGD